MNFSGAGESGHERCVFETILVEHGLALRYRWRLVPVTRRIAIDGPFREFPGEILRGKSGEKHP